MGRSTEQEARPETVSGDSHEPGPFRALVDALDELGWDAVGAQVMGLAGVALFICAGPLQIWDPSPWLKIAAVISVVVLAGGNLVERRRAVECRPASPSKRAEPEVQHTGGTKVPARSYRHQP